MEIGLLILRLILAAILFTHAMQKLSGWFGGNGLSKQAEVFSGLGLKPGRTFVVMAGTAELTAALLLVTGFLTPVGSLLAAGTMAVAGLTMHLNSGRFWNVAGGGEYPYVLAACAAVLGFTGGGMLSADHVLFNAVGDWYEVLAHPPAWLGLVIIALAAVGTIPFASMLKRSRA